MKNKKLQNQSFVEIPVGKMIVELDVDKIEPNPYNLRKDHDVKELKNSIKASDLKTPIKVRPHPERQGFFQIVQGYRRWFAHKELGRNKIKCIIEHVSDRDMLIESLVKNIQHKALTEMEEARGYQTLKKEFGFSTYQIADEVRESQAHVSQRLSLLKTPDKLQK